MFFIKYLTFFLFTTLLPNLLMADNTLEQNQKLTILTDHFPPLSYQNTNGEFIGSADLIVQQLFQNAHLSYQLVSQPWTRSLRQLEKDERVLIYPLSRTQDREEDYEWIAPLFRLEIKTFGLMRDSVNIDITEESYKFACIKTTINCLAVRSLNIQESSISELSNINISQLVNMVVYKRVDFIMMTEIEFAFALKSLNLAPSLFTKFPNYQYAATDYLAARKGFDAIVIKKLKSAILPKVLRVK